MYLTSILHNRHQSSHPRYDPRNFVILVRKNYEKLTLLTPALGAKAEADARHKTETAAENLDN